MTDEAKDAERPQCQDCGYQGSPVRKVSPRLYVGGIPFALAGLVLMAVYFLSIIAWATSIIAWAAVGYWLFVKKTCPKCNSENFGSRPTEQHFNESSTGRHLWIAAKGGALFLGIIFTLYLTLLLFSSPDKKVASQRSAQDVIPVLINTPPSTLRPEGELAEMFNLGSDNTDLQRQLKLKEIVGKIVEWQLPVYEVKQSGSGYLVQTSHTYKEDLFGKKLVGTFIHISPQDENDRRFVESLKTGSLVTFKGVINGTTMRTLDIRPAILVKGQTHGDMTN